MGFVHVHRESYHSETCRRLGTLDIDDIFFETTEVSNP